MHSDSYLLTDLNLFSIPVEQITTGAGEYKLTLHFSYFKADSFVLTGGM